MVLWFIHLLSQIERKNRMKRPIKQIFLFMLLSFFCASSFSAAPVDSSLAPMLQAVLPAIVNIRAKIKVTDFNTWRELQKQRGNKAEDSNQPIPNTYVSVASGVLVDAKNGYIITNAHVINDAQSVTVTLSDGRHFTAKIIGEDKPSDVAVLQIKAKNLTAITLADSNKIKVGDSVAAVGNPFGLNQTVTSGIISALGRTTLGIESYENFIQTDAPINPGNSGGALIDMHGQLIGINTAILAPDRGSIGIGFAIPSNMVKSVMQQLLEYGNVKRGVLGIGAQDITPELANAFHATTSNGAAVTLVLPNSPAAHAGLQVGDIITSVNGSNVKNASDVVNTIGFLRVDSRVNVNVLRNNKPMSVSVTLSDSSKRKEMEEKADPFLYGVALKNFTLFSPVHGNVQGVLVVGVDEDTNAWNSDLRPGDVITSVNQQKITAIPELRTAVSKSSNALLLNVLRGSSAIFLVISTQQ
jgi:serine protease Do